jgi:hypothetical protein
MVRDPSKEELAQIQGLLATSGSRKEFDRWVELARRQLELPKPKRGVGRPAGLPKYYQSDLELILLAERVFRSGGRKPTAAIKFVCDRYFRPELAASPNALKARLLDRLSPEPVETPEGQFIELWPTKFPQLDQLSITEALAASRRKRQKPNHSRESE